jgi:hypothetical protein
VFPTPLDQHTGTCFILQMYGEPKGTSFRFRW